MFSHFTDSSIRVLLSEMSLVSGDDVMNHFKSLKDTFMRNWRKVQESKSSGAGSHDVYRPKWSLFSNLKFLLKMCVQSGSTSNIESQTQNTSSQGSVVEIELQNQTQQYYYDENLQVRYFHIL